jgi:hypothetical protein
MRKAAMIGGGIKDAGIGADKASGLSRLWAVYVSNRRDHRVAFDVFPHPPSARGRQIIDMSRGNAQYDDTF